MKGRYTTERLDRFFLIQGLDGNNRLVTREEFKAEFDQILRSAEDLVQETMLRAWQRFDT